MSALPLHSATTSDSIRTELEATLKLQREAYLRNPYPSLAQRKESLRKLKAMIQDNRDAILDAISADYGNRSRHETLFAEIFGTIDGIDHTIKHLAGWMKPQRRWVDWKNFFGARNKVIPQPLGVVGAIVPWNFPIFLGFGGLVSTFAAGNRSMVKLSENSRNLAKLLIELTPRYFQRDQLAFIDETGGVGVEFSRLPFNHILFTGSGQTGRSVMAAAAQNLCPVTLELGGKSPSVICDDYPLQKAIERILFVKCFNAGQICTNVDYAFVPEYKVQEFVEIAKKFVPQRYASIDSKDYTSIIDKRSFDRLVQALEEARDRGATLVQLLPGKPWDEATRKIAPHLVLGAPEDCALRTREIFGPILPVVGYRSLDEVVTYINSKPRPLAFYPFSNHSEVISDLITRIMSGGVSVNDALLHTGQHDLPFGGVGESGMGHYHGYEGFLTFSKLRPVFYQASFSAIKFLWPPYGKFATKYLDFLTK